VYLLKHKSEVFNHFLIWKAMVESQSGKLIITFRTDYRGEYLSSEFSDELAALGIVHQTTTPGYPQQNGVAERFNGVLLEMARSMIHGAGLSKGFWGEAVPAANYIRVRCPTSSVPGTKTPIELWSGVRPSIHHLRVFGCKVSVMVPEQQRSKLDAKSWSGVFVGYSSTQKGYRVCVEFL